MNSIFMHHDYETKPLFNNYSYNKNSLSELIKSSYELKNTSNEYILNEFESILIYEHKLKINSLMLSISKDIELKKYKSNINKLIRKVLFSYAERIIFEKRESIFCIEKFDDYLISEICKTFKLSKRTFIDNEQLIYNCFKIYIEINPTNVKSDWGYYFLDDEKKYIFISTKSSYWQNIDKQIDYYKQNVKTYERETLVF